MPPRQAQGEALARCPRDAIYPRLEPRDGLPARLIARHAREGREGGNSFPVRLQPMSLEGVSEQCGNELS
jgi:hypothetical protein